MLKVRPRTLLIVLPFLILNAAGWLWLHSARDRSQRDSVMISALLPGGDADTVDRLALVFDRPIGGETDSTFPPPHRLFSLSPEPPGTWRWACPERLEYILDAKLPPGRVYRVEPSSEFESLTGWRIDEQEAEEREFRTRSLVLLGVSAEVAGVDIVHLLFRFNQPVLPEDLKRHLSLRGIGGDDPGSAYFPSYRPTEVVTASIHRGEAEQIEAEVGGDLTGHQGQRPLGRTVIRKVDLPKSFGLLGGGFSGFRDRTARPDRSTVSLRFSSYLDQTAPVPQVRVSPPVEQMETRWGTYASVLEIDALFECGRRYVLTLLPGAMAADGRTVEEEQTVEVRIPERKPSVEIPRYRGVLSPDGNLALDLRVVNVPRVRVKAWRVHDNNLVPHLQRHRRKATTRALFSREYDVEIDRNRRTDATIDLRELLDQPLGIYYVEVESTEHYWRDDEAVVTVTDLALTAKTGREGVTVWVTSITSGKPVEGARVAAVSYNNQVLADGETDENGLAVLSVSASHPDGKPWLLTAAHGPDRAYQGLDRNQWLLDDVDQTGRTPPQVHDVFLYCERGVYRPGDTVHVTGVVRDADGGVPSAFPLEVRVLRPDDREAASFTVTPGEQGVFHLEFPVAEDARTGPYRFLAGLPGAKSVLGRTHALVEAFLPVRIELTAEVARDLFTGDESPKADLAARYFFDQPASDLPVRLAWRYRPRTFRSKSRPEYRFGAPVDDDPIDGREKDLALDDEGRLEVVVPPPKDRLERFDLSATATVVEPGSRSVSRRFTTVLDRTPRHLGFELPKAGWLPVDRPIELPFVLCTPEDEAAEPAAMECSLARLEYDWEYQQVNGRWRFRSLERPVLLAEFTVGEDAAEGTVEIRCPTAGRHELVVKDPDTGGTRRLEFYAAESESDAKTLRLGEPDRVELALDRERYRPGETAEVLVRSPFAGTLLLTVETTDVLVRKVVVLEGSEQTVSIEVPEGLRGSGFLSATVVRPVDPNRDTWGAHRAFGLTRIRTDHEPRRLAVSIEAPDRAEPKSEVSVSVLVSRNGESADEGAEPATGAVVHLFAVDEGILAASDFATPSPFDHYFGDRAAAVSTCDLFPDLIPDLLPAEGMQRIGGGSARKDDRGRESLRRNPVPTKRRAPAVVWLEAVPVDEEGRANFELVLPELHGAVRLMAVAVEDDRYGSCEESVVLTSDVIAETGWPRFLAPGDRRPVPVKVFNQTDGDREFGFTLTFTGPIVVSDPEVAGLLVPAGESRTAWIEIEATGVGPAEVRLAVLSVDGGVPLGVEAEGFFPVRPGNPLHSASDFHRLKPGETATLRADRSFLPGARRSLRISGAPNLELRPAMDRLMGYPYGCVEQTTSRLMAIVHAPALMEGDDESRAALAREVIDAGLRRLESMQTESGGLSYWPGSARACRWGTGYVGEFLVEARDAGVEIPKRLLDGVLRYLQDELGATGDAQPSLNERALFARVLAAFDRAPLGWLTRLSEAAAELDIAGRAHLAAGWVEAGRSDRALAVLGADTMWITVATTTDGRITSRTRQDAVLLKALLHLDETHHWVDLLAAKLAERRENGAWRSTLEDAAALSALARYHRARGGETEAGDFMLEITCGGARFTADHRKPVLIDLPDADSPIRIDCAGEGTAFLILQTEGIAKDARTKRYDRGISVRREWFDPTGEPLDLDTVRVGDLVQVKVTLKSTEPQRIGNIAVVDPLPGGFEVENPRLATAARVPSQNRAAADRVEFLDDRVVLFATAHGAEQTFVYAIRATGAGSFAVPPVQASCMYEPAVASISGGGTVEIAR